VVLSAIPAPRARHAEAYEAKPRVYSGAWERERDMWLCSRQGYDMNHVESKYLLLVSGSLDLSACTMINAQARYD